MGAGDAVDRGDGSGETRKECVWDYPRPPRLEPTRKHLRVEVGDVVLADTRSAYRVLETSHPPVYYLPPCDVAMERLVQVAGGSYCEWKGEALYYSIVLEGRRIERAAWSYPDPSPAFGPIAGYVAFYASERVACFVDGERVASQPGDFYGGWITSDLIGPFKGAPGTSGW